ncbi:hypothetical protein K9L67_00110 [Candidatus Woesearchaeota archaeon]|nr:hypothetical protein [Candidatus Woesearchaeota archaeon]MCF7900610.1 hypothetical protein [Candidatus Woesearchaeota archaeon]MCF8013900.1 hypothetical protein [Candidatus Woesearchaeota archaeon]
MSIRDMKGKIEDEILINNILISVYDKSELENFVPNLIIKNPDITLLSTGGTFRKIKEILGEYFQRNLIEVSDYTEFPEMEGGLVKTLHPKIHAGILGERNNKEHQKYLQGELQGASYIDAVIVNLYPFKEVISKPDVTFEQARGNIDIGGPTMIRAAAKNFPSCLVITNPVDYKDITFNGKLSTNFHQRLKYAAKAFTHTAEYEKNIAEYFGEVTKKENVDEILAMVIQ